MHPSEESCQEEAGVRSPSSLRIAVGVRRSISTFEMHLVRPGTIEFQKEVVIKPHAAVFPDNCLHHPSANAIGIELLIPRRVKRIGEVHSPAVTADLDHLRAAVKCFPRFAGVWS